MSFESDLQTVLGSFVEVSTQMPFSRSAAPGQKRLWNEADVSRESEAHEGKRPGEFAPKGKPKTPAGQNLLFDSGVSDQPVAKPAPQSSTLEKIADEQSATRKPLHGQKEFADIKDVLADAVQLATEKLKAADAKIEELRKHTGRGDLRVVAAGHDRENAAHLMSAFGTALARINRPSDFAWRDPEWHAAVDANEKKAIEYLKAHKRESQFSRDLDEIGPVEFSVAAPPRNRRLIDDKRTRNDVDEDEKVFGKKKRIPTDGNKPETGWTKVGGSTVHVNDDGVIDKGCPGLKGEEVEDLIDESDESRERREARQAYARAAGITGDQITAEQAKAMGSDAHVEGMKQAKAAAEADPRPTIGTSDVLRGVDDQTGEPAGNGHELLQSNNREHPESNEQFEGTGMPSPMKFMDDEDEGTRPQWMGPKLSEMVPIPPPPKFLRDRRPIDHDEAATYKPKIAQLEADIEHWRNARDAMKKGGDISQFNLAPEQKSLAFADAKIKELKKPLDQLKRKLSDYTMRSTPNQNPKTQTWTSMDEAAQGAEAKFGIPIHHITAAMPDAYLFRLAQSIEHEALKKAARDKTKLDAGDISRIGNQYKDWSTVPRFDEASREFAGENPNAGFDPYAHDTPERVWNLIHEGATVLPPKDSPEIAELAAQMISGDYNRTSPDFASDDDDTPVDDWGHEEHGDTSFDPNSFSRSLLNVGPVEFARVKPARNQSAFNWDEDAHPREATVHDGKRPGEFAAKQGVAAPQEIDHEFDYKQNGTRSKAFKAWFGDWEHDPANASKVVDADGEPQETASIPGEGSKVMKDGKPIGVYHGTGKGGWDKFDKAYSGRATAGSDPNLLLYGPGFYFTEDHEVAADYAKIGSKDVYETKASRQQLVDIASKSQSALSDEFQLWKNAGMEGDAGHLKHAIGHLENLKTLANIEKASFENNQDVLRALRSYALMAESPSDPDQAPVKTGHEAIVKRYSGEVKNVYLNIRKPFDIDGKTHVGDIAGLKRAFGEKLGGKIASAYGYTMTGEYGQWAVDNSIVYSAATELYGGKSAANENLANMGFDGITHIGGDRMGGGHHHRVWIAFEPNQIKAVNNRGTFNPEDDRLEFSRSDELDTIAERMGVDADALRAAIASMPGPKSESLTWIRKLMHDPSRGVLRDRNGHVIGFLTRNGQKIQLRDARGHQSGTVTGSSFRDSKGHVTGTLQEFSQQLHEIEPVEFARIKPATGQMSLFDEGKVNRETTQHEGKRPGEFAPKTEPAATPAPATQKPRKIGKREFKAAPSTTVDFPQTNSFGPIPGVKMKHIDGTTFFTNPKDDTHVLAKVPTHHVERFMDEISGRLTHPANSGHPTLDRVLSGHGTHIGKGHESTAFDAGNGMIVKAAVLTPFHISQHGVRTPAEANKIVDDSVAVTKHLRAAGVPGILPQYGIQHDGRSFAVQKKVDTQSPLQAHHFDQLEKTIQGIHSAGYTVRDQIQAGLDHNGNAAIYDIGSAAKHDGGQYDEDDMRQDFSNLSYLAKKHGVDYKTPSERRASDDYDGMLWAIQDHPGMTRDEARKAKLKLIGAAKRAQAVNPSMHELLSDTHADAMQKLEGWINQPKVEMSRAPAAGQGSFNWDADEHPRDEAGRFKDKLHHQIKEYLSDGSHRHIRDIHDHTGHKDYDALDPLSNKANAALKELRDSGQISGTSPSIREPHFHMTEEQIAAHKNPESVKEKDTEVSYKKPIGVEVSDKDELKSKEVGRTRSAIHFDPAIVGPSGATLTSYEWRFEWIMDDEKSDDPIRVSDWNESEHNEHTKRQVVHVFHVADADGDQHSVSLETAVKLLGLVKKSEDINKVKSLAQAAIKLAQAKQEHEKLLADKSQQEKSGYGYKVKSSEEKISDLESKMEFLNSEAAMIGKGKSPVEHYREVAHKLHLLKNLFKIPVSQKDKRGEDWSAYCKGNHAAERAVFKAANMSVLGDLGAKTPIPNESITDWRGNSLPVSSDQKMRNWYLSNGKDAEDAIASATKWAKENHPKFAQFVRHEDHALLGDGTGGTLKREEYDVHERLEERSAPSKHEAWMNYRKTNRIRPHSFIAESPSGRFSIVDGTDKDERRYYKSAGFKKVSEQEPADPKDDHALKIMEVNWRSMPPDILRQYRDELKKRGVPDEAFDAPEEFSRLMEITPIEFARKPAPGQKGFDFDAPAMEPIADKEAESEPTKQSSLFADIPAEHLDEAKKLSELHGGREVKKTKTGWQVRSPKGGKVSEVNGVFFPGGQFMPIHGLTEKKAAKPPKAERPKLPESSPQEKKEKTDGGWSGGPRSPMTPDEIEELRKRREEEKTWADIQRSPLGRLLDLGDKPKWKQGTIPITDQWREYAERVGPAAMAEMKNQFEKEVHENISKTWADRIEKESAMTDDQIRSRYGIYGNVKRLSPEDAEWDKNQLKESAENSATGWKPRTGKAIEKSVPGTHYVRELIGHILSTDNGLKIGEMKRIGEILAAHESASRSEMADPVEAKKNGYFPNKFPGTTASGKKVKAGDGWVKKNPQTGKYETFTDDEVKSAVQQFSRDLELCLQEFSRHEFSSTQLDITGDIAKAMLAIGKSIPKSELSDDGLEKDCHVTVLYGLHADDTDELQELAKGFGPITIKFGKTSIFPANKGQEQRGGAQYDVLKIDIEGDDIHRLNKLLRKMDHTSTFPKYHPHATIGYLKPGEGAKFCGKNPLTGKEITFDSFIFSGRDGAKTEIPLVDKTEEFSRLDWIENRMEFEFARRRPDGNQNSFGWSDEEQETPVQSSNVHSFAWEGPPATGNLLVRFKNKQGGSGPLYRYHGTPHALYDGMAKAASKGKFVWDSLRMRGTVSGHQFPYSLIHTGDTKYVPRQAGLRRGYTGEHFLKRTLNGVESQLAPAPVKKGPARRIPGYDPNKLKLPGETTQQQATVQSQTSAGPTPAPVNPPQPTTTPQPQNPAAQNPQTPPSTPPNKTKGLIDRVLDFFKKKRKKPDDPKQFSRAEWDAYESLVKSGFV